MSEISKNFPTVVIDRRGTKRKIAAATAAVIATFSGALLENSNITSKKTTKIGGKIAPGPYTVTYYTINDAVLKQNPQTIQYPYEQSLHSQYYYSNEFEVVLAGYLCYDKQEIVQSIEEEENIISMGGTPIWYGVITQNGEIIYFRAEDIRMYVMKKESENTKKLVRN